MRAAAEKGTFGTTARQSGYISDVTGRKRYDRFWHEGDMPMAPSNVCVRGQTDMVASSGCQSEVLICTTMSILLSRMVAAALAGLLLGTAATASARPKKASAERASTAITTCDGTPIIMQGIDCKKRLIGGEEQATKRTVRPRVTTRGSGGPYAPARLSTPSLALPQQSAAPYIPPPINNPSGQINQLNQSFPLNRGLGNNPTDRDAYIRYNLTR
jgi:hypothetical protein